MPTRSVAFFRYTDLPINFRAGKNFCREIDLIRLGIDSHSIVCPFSWSTARGEEEGSDRVVGLEYGPPDPPTHLWTKPFSRANCSRGQQRLLRPVCPSLPTAAD